MPRRKDLKKVLLIGAGPVAPGRACEYDYAGALACGALKEEGIFTIVVNSDPATIMTDPDMADAAYIEPLTVEAVAEIIRKEKPNAILTAFGGQTALNLAYFLMKEGVLDKYGVETIGCGATTIPRTEDRVLFRQAMREINIGTPNGGAVVSVADGMKIGRKAGFPLVIRPSFRPDGAGGAKARNNRELEAALTTALKMSPVGQALVEQSVAGWKEIEFEVMRDRADNVVIIASMENVDPMGVHTGDSMAAAPCQTISASEYIAFANLSRKIIRKVGIVGGGVNIQFAQNPDDGEIAVIEVNPRFTRSAALASKATGFPIARVAAKLAVGLTLPEVMNQVTGCTTAFFEPAVDFCVFKIPRFDFDRFPRAERVIGASMKAGGEAMSIGGNFREALQKGIRSAGTGRFGLGADGRDEFNDAMLTKPSKDIVKKIKERISVPGDDRLFYIRYGFKAGMTADEIHRLSGIDRWFIDNVKNIVELEEELKKYKCKKEGDNPKIPPDLLIKAKSYGFSDAQTAFLLNTTERKARAHRKQCGIRPAYRQVDTCGGEFKAERPYYYSTYETENESVPSKNRKVLLLGGGPNGIGRGIEDDYCICHASRALREEGIESIMINCNPGNVSTDLDSSDKLYFEPLTVEDVLNAADLEKPMGAIVQFGGRAALGMAAALEREGLKILDSVPSDPAEEDRRIRDALLKLKIPQPESGAARSAEKAVKIASKTGYPVIVRAYRADGGGSAEIVRDGAGVAEFAEKAAAADPDTTILIEKFLEDAIEVDVDAVADGRRCVIGGVLEHVERAGVHSGDSAMVMPPHSLDKETVETIKKHTRAVAAELKVKGLLNVRFAVRDGVARVLRVSPRASRTVPFVSKATGVPLVGLAVKIMLGKTLEHLDFTGEKEIGFVAIREAVFPFASFPGADAALGPEMKSTGAAMGIDAAFGAAFAKSQIAAGQMLPKKGNLLLSARDRDKDEAAAIAKKLGKLGFKLFATSGTAGILKKNGMNVKIVPKINEGKSPNIVDMIKSGKANLLIITPLGGEAGEDEAAVMSSAVMSGVPLITTIAGARASVAAIEHLVRNQRPKVKSLQEHYKEIK